MCCRYVTIIRSATKPIAIRWWFETINQCSEHFPQNCFDRNPDLALRLVRYLSRLQIIDLATLWRYLGGDRTFITAQRYYCYC
jgi:hypothetical protein